MSRGLPRKIKKCLEKAIDSSLLAVETYNKPAIKFKSGSYIVLMNIAWTSLFHATFFKQKIQPYYRKAGSNRFLQIDGDYKCWELNTCLEQYYKADTQNPVRKNIEFFIKLRNKIVHRSIPEIDNNIFGECQAWLFNFDKFIEIEFGEKYCIRESLSFSLQMFPSRESLSSAINNSSVAANVLAFINNFRSSISNEIIESGNYSFKAFLFQVANHQNNDTQSIQFIQWDKLSDEEKLKAKKIVALIRNKQTEIPVINADLFKPKEVVQKVQEGLGNKTIQKGGKTVDYFNMNTHSRAWKKYNARPCGKTKSPSKTNKEFCFYDKAHDDYLYKENWIQFLIDKLKDDEEYRALYNVESKIL
jgi:hypothetical protein